MPYVLAFAVPFNASALHWFGRHPGLNEEVSLVLQTIHEISRGQEQ